MRVENLEGMALDYWVARADEQEIKHAGKSMWIVNNGFSAYIGGDHVPHYAPSTNWAQAGVIIEREKLELTPLYDMRNRFVYWTSQPSGAGHLSMEDESPLVAAMRGYVASKFGFNVPDELEPA